MGMRVGGSNAMSGTQSPSVAGAQQRQQSFKALVTALQSGNLTAARAAYASLHKSGSTQASANSPVAQIGQALQGGDLAGAQRAMQSLLGHGGGTSAPAAPEAADGSTIDTKA